MAKCFHYRCSALQITNSFATLKTTEEMASSTRVLLRPDMNVFDILKLASFLAGEEPLNEKNFRYFDGWDHRHYESNVDRIFRLYKPANPFGRSPNMSEIVKEQEAANVTLLIFNPRCSYSLEETEIKATMESSLGFVLDPKTKERKLVLPTANWLDLSGMPIALVACDDANIYNADNITVKETNFTYADLVHKNLAVAEEIAKEKGIKLFVFKASLFYHVENDKFEEMDISKPLEERRGKPTNNLRTQKDKKNNHKELVLPQTYEQETIPITNPDEVDDTTTTEDSEKRVEKRVHKQDDLFITREEITNILKKLDDEELSRSNKRVRQLLYEHMRDIAEMSPLERRRERERRGGVVNAVKRLGKWMASYAFTIPPKEMHGRVKPNPLGNITTVDHWQVEVS